MKRTPILYITIIFIVFEILNISCTNESRYINSNDLEHSDSLSFFLKQSRNPSIDNKNRQFALYQGINYLDNKRLNDSIRSFYIIKLSYSAYLLKDINSFNNLIENSIQHSIRLSDTLTLAKAYKYKGYLYDDVGLKLESFINFSKSYKLYEKKNDLLNSAKILYRLSLVQLDLHQYNEAENDSYEALTIFDDFHEKKKTANCYTLLGSINHDIKNHDIAIKYYNQSKEYINELDSLHLSTINNNIGVVYSSKNEYLKAIINFKDALNYVGLVNSNPKLYIKLSDNLAFAKFKANIKNNSIEDIKENYLFKQNINDTAGVIANRLYLSEIFEDKKNHTEATDKAKNALLLSTKSNNNILRLKSLKQLIDVDTLNAKMYSNMYLSLKDSIDINDRKVRNKLGRIRMETDQYISKSEVLEKKNYWLIFAVATLFVLIGAIYLYSKQRIILDRILKENELNEKIQNLLAKEKININKARKSVNDNISKELHDNILSKIFGVRYNLELYSNDKSIKYINTLKEIELEIRDISHEMKKRIDSDISKATKTLLDEMLSSYRINSNHYDDFEYWNIVNDKIKINIYRIIQESLMNIIKHAKSRNVVVKYYSSENNLILEIIDDGIGFVTDSKNKGIGLINIKERAKEIDALLEIISSPNNGTKIFLKIPINVN